MPQIFRKLQGLAVIKAQEKYFRIKELKLTSTVEADETITDERILTCEDIKTQKEVKFKVTAKNLFDAFYGAVEAEKETKCLQILLVNFDTGEWRSYPITEELIERFPLSRLKSWND